jgi:hypothetical protein
VEWRGKKPGKKRVSKAKDALGVRASFALDAKTLAAFKAKRGAAKSGADDCEKKLVDWEQSDAALSCNGQEVTVSLRAGTACGDKQTWLDTWTLSNHTGAWQLFSRGVADANSPTQ